MINQMIKKNNHFNLQNAVLNLISCFPVHAQNIDDFYNLRQTIWQFARDFYPETPRCKTLVNWTEALWEEGDKLIIIMESIESELIIINIFSRVNYLNVRFV